MTIFSSAGSDLLLLPGAQYTLTAQTSEGSITGSTCLPGEFSILAPVNGFSMAVPETVIVEVTAFDQNFYNHKFLGNNQAGVTGGYGVVGSGVMHSVVLPIQK